MSEFERVGDIYPVKNILLTRYEDNKERIFRIGKKMQHCPLRRGNGLNIQLILNIGQLLNEYGDESAITPEMICKNCAKKNECCKKK